MMKDLVFAQALLLTGQLEEKQQELLRLLCGAESCGADFIAAASLYAVAALEEARERGTLEEVKAGDLTVKTGSGKQEGAAKALFSQAEMLMKPYFADCFTFVGV